MNVVDKTIDIDASVDTVWRYLSQPELLARWLMQSDFSGIVGKDFRFQADPKEEWDGNLYCRLVEFEAPRKLAFTWDANDIQGETLVTITLTPVAGKTRLRLIHANFDNAKLDIGPIVERHSQGWKDHLELLRQQVERPGKIEQRVSPVDQGEGR